MIQVIFNFKWTYSKLRDDSNIEIFQKKSFTYLIYCNLDINDVIDSYSDRSSLDTSIEYNDSYTNAVTKCIKKGKIHLTKYKLINGVLQSTDSVKRHKNEVRQNNYALLLWKGEKNHAKISK